ncbi:MAG TPA: YCF48-related protein [Albitalea sp.]
MTRKSRLVALLSLCVAFAAAPAQAGVDQLTLPALKAPRAAKSMLLGVALAGPRIVAVGERGIIVFSDDRGSTWQQADVPVSATLTGVTFAGTHQGWAVGHDGLVLHSADAGKSWTKQFDGNQANALIMAAAQERVARAASESSAAKRAEQALQDAKAAAKFGPSRPLLAVWFKNESEGFAAGSYGLLLRTRDGGAHWELWSDHIDNPEGLHFNAIAATPSGALVIAGEAGNVWRSADGGTTWEGLPTGYKGQLYGALAMRNAGGGEDLLAFGFKGNLFRLAANTRGWETLASGTTKNLSGGVLLSDGSPALVSQDGRLVLGSADGKRFKVVPGAPLPAVAIARGPADAGVAVSGIGGVSLVFLSAQNDASKP